ncbi:MAG: DNA primase [Mycoplasmataceae bacterium]|nr:DNA primase [Mycoplasmataceae bacterium]
MNRIPNSKIEEIQKKSNIVDVISSYINVTKKGNNYVAICPFHDDKTPSLSISENKQLFKCFSCGMGGNVFKFISEFEKTSYINAVNIAAKKIGIELNFENDISKNGDELYSYIKEINIEATNLWSYNLTQSDEAKSYLISRKITKEDIEEFSIGYAPLGSYKLYTYLLNKGYSMHQIFDAGLAKKKDGEILDYFFNRIIFPIKNEFGEIIGFSGRDISNKAGAKYLNSPETKLFRKSLVLYNLNLAINNSRINNTINIVEGFFDVISLYRSGIKNAVGLMGTSFNKELVKKLKKYSKNINLIADNDIPGMNSAIKSYRILNQYFEKVSFILIPDGYKDVDEILSRNKNFFSNESINKLNLTFIEFYYHYLIKKYGVKNINDNLNTRIEFFDEINEELYNVNQVTLDYLRSKISTDLNIELDKVIDYTHLETSNFSIDSYENEYLDEIDNDVSLFQKETYAKATDLLVSMMMNTPSKTKVIFEKLDECNFSTSNEKLNKFLYLLKKNDMSIEKLNSLLKLTEYRDLKRFVEKSSTGKNGEFSLKKLNEVIEIFRNFHTEKACSIIDKKLISAISSNDKNAIEQLMNDWKENQCEVINKHTGIFSGTKKM